MYIPKIDNNKNFSTPNLTTNTLPSIFQIFQKYVGSPITDLLSSTTKTFFATSKSEKERLTEKLMSITCNEDQPKLQKYVNDNTYFISLKNIFSTQHIYERMKTFGHQLSFNDKGELTLKVSQAHHFKEFVNDKSLINWEELKNELIAKNIRIEVKGMFQDGRYQTLDPSNISLVDLELYLTSEASNTLLISHQDLTLSELISMKILSLFGGINQQYHYTENGLEPINLQTPVFLNTTNDTLISKRDKFKSAIHHCKMIKEIQSRHQEFKDSPESRNFMKNFINNQLEEIKLLLDEKETELLSLMNKENEEIKTSLINCTLYLQNCTYANYRDHFPDLKEEEIELIANSSLQLHQIQKYQLELLMLLNIFNHPNDHFTMERLEKSLLYMVDVIHPNSFEKLQNLGVNTLPDQDIRWKNLKPYQHTNPQDNFTVDVIVHSPSENLPGVFDIKAHASIKMTTPKGEVYSVGFQPVDTSSNLKLREGKLETPDHFIFMPEKNYHQHTMSYVLPDASSFHQLVNWIEDIQANPTHEDFPLLYHPTHHNCAAFVKTVKNKVMALGGKTPPTEKKATLFNKIKTVCEKNLLKILITTPGLKTLSTWIEGIDNYNGIKNYNITHMKDRDFYLPIDLILDYETL